MREPIGATARRELRRRRRKRHRCALNSSADARCPHGSAKARLRARLGGASGRAARGRATDDGVRTRIDVGEPTSANRCPRVDVGGSTSAGRRRRGPRHRPTSHGHTRPHEAAGPSRRTRRPGAPMRAASVDAGAPRRDGASRASATDADGRRASTPKARTSPARAERRRRRRKRHRCALNSGVDARCPHGSAKARLRARLGGASGRAARGRATDDGVRDGVRGGSTSAGRRRRGPRHRPTSHGHTRPHEAAGPSRRTRRPGAPMRAAGVDAGAHRRDGASRASATEAKTSPVRAELRRRRAVSALERQGAPPCAAWRYVGARGTPARDGRRGANANRRRRTDVGEPTSANRCPRIDVGGSTSAGRRRRVDVGAAPGIGRRRTDTRAPTRPPGRRVGRDAPALPCARRASMREPIGATARRELRRRTPTDGELRRRRRERHRRALNAGAGGENVTGAR
jgi:hypothetical protein